MSENTSSELQLFSNDEFELRVEPDDDRLKFYAPGLARGLAYRDALTMLRGLPDSCKGYTNSRTPGGDQQTWYVTEGGLYRLLGQRQTTRIKDTAQREFVERFQSWVFDDVLPAVRRTGTYVIPGQRQPHTDVASIDRRAMALMILEAEDALEASETRNRELEVELADAAPLVAAARQFLTSDASRLLREVAKELNWQEKALRMFLIEEKLIFARQALCGRNQYDLYAAYAPHFRPVEKVVTHTWGDCSHYTLTVTPRGLDLIRKRIADRTALVAASVASTPIGDRS